MAANNWTTLAAYSAATNQGGALAYLPAANLQGRSTQLTVTPSLIGAGGSYQVAMTLSSTVAVGSATPGTLTPTATGGASGSCTGPSPASQGIAANGSATFTWTCTATAGATPGSLRYTANGTGTSPSVSFPSATSNSMLVSPNLTYSATVNSPAPASGVVENTGLLVKAGAEPGSFPSNTTLTNTSASIGNFVWSDTDGDGIQDSGESGIAAVRVYIDANGNGAYDTGELNAITGVNGLYTISNLNAATYAVRIDPATYPSGFVPTTAGLLNVTLTTGQQYVDADFGLQPPVGSGPSAGSIGDTVWLDADNDGLQDAGEQPLSGITVKLYRDLGNDGVIDATDPLVETGITDANGLYGFFGLPIGAGSGSPVNYLVQVDTSSTRAQSIYTDDHHADGQHVTDYRHADQQHTASLPLRLGSANVTNADFGYRWGGSIGDFVWYDGNADGIQEHG